MVFLGDGHAKESHEAIAQELCDHPLMAVDLALGQLEKPLHELVHRFGSESLSQSCDVSQGAAEHRDLLALSCRCVLGRERRFGQIWRRSCWL
jgi:hypothetical protein